MILECFGSLAGDVEGSQPANVLAMLHTHHTAEDGTIKFIIDAERLW
jgi:hypothetical protein